MSADDELTLVAWKRTARREPAWAGMRIALDEQRWLAAVMHEERRRTPLEERDAYDARCDRMLARLDPIAVEVAPPEVPVVMAPPADALRPGADLRTPLPRAVARRRPLADAGA